MMITKLLITRPVKDDIKSAYSVFEASIADAFEKDGLGHLKTDIVREIEQKKQQFKSSIDNSDSHIYFLVAKIANDVIGTISFGSCGDDIRKCTENELDTVGEMGSIYVLPCFQDKGVASALIYAMTEHLYKSGIKQFFIDSGYKHAQQRWLRKFGKPYKTVKNYWNENGDHMVWLCNVTDYVKK